MTNNRTKYCIECEKETEQEEYKTGISECVVCGRHNFESFERRGAS